MKTLIRVMLMSFTICFLTVDLAISALLVEYVIPQYFGCKSSLNLNISRTPVAVCLRIADLSPNTTYDLKIGLIYVGESSTSDGAGNVWLSSSQSFSGQDLDDYITTDANGDTGPFWCFIQPSSNEYRFNPGQVHQLKIYYKSGTYFNASNYLITSNKLTALDIPNTEASVATNDDGAFIYGITKSFAEGKFALFFDNVNGTGAPLSVYQIRNGITTNPPQSQLPFPISDFYNQSGVSRKGHVAGIIPSGINNPNGVRRVEIRNLDGTYFYNFTDPDGIWPNGFNTNTTDLERNETSIIEFPDILLIKEVEQARWKKESNTTNPDTTKIILRHIDAPYVIVEESKSKLDSTGTGIFEFNNTSDSVNYYLTVRHRNSIETWSAAPVSFSDGVLNYDFTTSSSQAYGNNMIQVDSTPVVFAIHSGDPNQDGNVDVDDIVIVYNDALNFVGGYVPSDINGDDFTDVTDLIVTYNNSNQFISKVTP